MRSFVSGKLVRTKPDRSPTERAVVARRPGSKIPVDPPARSLVLVSPTPGRSLELVCPRRLGAVQQALSPAYTRRRVYKAIGDGTVFSPKILAQHFLRKR